MATLKLLTTQFFGAFNDNAWKLILFTLATRTASATGTETHATLAMLTFLLPMCLFSLPALVLADRISKSQLIRKLKGIEIVIMGCATLVLAWQPQELALPFGLLALMGAQSAFFTPAKYGILPEVLPKEALSRANAWLELGTMLAIIAGTGFGPLLLAADLGGLRPEFSFLAPAFLTLTACVGYWAARGIPSVEAASKQGHPLPLSIYRAWCCIRRDRTLWLSFLGSVLYWMVLSLLGQHVLVYAKTIVAELQSGELWQGIPPAAFGLGIGIGALFSGQLSKERIELGLIPLGAIGFSLSALTMGVWQPWMVGTVLYQARA